jgi:hypothetical protein
LKVDGTFCAAVLTADGAFVPGAQLTLFRDQGDAPPLRLVTGVEGQTVVTGIAPGLYSVQVDSPKGNYQGRLQVQNSDPRLIAQAPVVPFTVTPQGGAVSEGEFVEDGGYAAPDDPRWRRRALLLFGLGAGVATAIAVPIAVHDEHEPPPPVASP